MHKCEINMRLSPKSLLFVLTILGMIWCLKVALFCKHSANFLGLPVLIAVREDGDRPSMRSCPLDTVLSDAFKPQISWEEKALLKDLLSTAQHVLTANSLEFFLVDGSLLGSYRHHDMIPWDDDIDIMINADLRPRVRQAMSVLPSNYRLYTTEDLTWRLCFSWTKPLGNLTWPFLDLFFFTTNSSHIIHDFRGSLRYFPKSIIYPLTMRPFMGLWVPAPKNTKAYLTTAKYNIDMCEIKDFSHKLDKERDDLKLKGIPCECLHDIYSFVKRDNLILFVKEALYMRGKCIHVKYVSS